MQFYFHYTSIRSGQVALQVTVEYWRSGGLKRTKMNIAQKIIEAHKLKFGSLPPLQQCSVSGSTFVNADCFDVFPFIEDKSIDAIICDLPYGTTSCKWDSILPLDKLWVQYKRVLKSNGVVVLFGSQPFTSVLNISNIDWFKYELIWEKNIPSGYFNAKKQQMKIHENISIFTNGVATYNPQMVLRSEEEYKKTLRINDSECFNADVYGGGRKKLIRKTSEEQKYKYPFTICKYDIDRSYGYDKHPTKKPLALMEYLVGCLSYP